MASREICHMCFHVNRVGFNVPEEMWRAVVPAELQNSVVCLDCFSRLADEKLVRWDDSIALYPVSMATHLGLSSGDGADRPLVS